MDEVVEAINALNQRLCRVEGQYMALQHVITHQAIMILAQNPELKDVWDETIQETIASFDSFLGDADAPTRATFNAALKTLNALRSQELFDRAPTFPFEVIKGGRED
ncbi:hypothetical protein [Brucella anthropi]|uniref:hypothetical protein n=1 Tax=Brucella anthropi TaxID=529 RepID=UPI0009BDBC67|nr:hypothetical protein [Brucella anthropi]